MLMKFRVTFEPKDHLKFRGQSRHDFGVVEAESEGAVRSRLGYEAYPVDGNTSTYFIRGHFTRALRIEPLDTAGL